MRHAGAMLCAVGLLVPGCRGGSGNGTTEPPADAPTDGAPIDGLPDAALPPALVLDLLAGNIGGGGNLNGVGIAARFAGPSAVAVDAARAVFVADTGNHTIRKIAPDGTVTTFAGAPDSRGSTDGLAGAARFANPRGLAIDGAGTLYVADTGNNTIRKITSAGLVSTLAGAPGTFGSVDGRGAAARFNTPTGLTIDAAGTLYISDAGTQILRKLTPAGDVSTIAGASGMSGIADGTADVARFNSPTALAVDSAGNLLIADQGSHTIRKLTAGGLVSTIAGAPRVSGSADGNGSTAHFSQPDGIAVDRAGNVFVSDSVNCTLRKITPAGDVTTFTGAALACGADDGTTGARLSNLAGLAIDGADNLYVADAPNDMIRKVTPGRVVTTLAGAAELHGRDDAPGAGARFFSPEHLAVDPSGNVFVSDVLNHTIRKITPAGIVSTLAGSPGKSGTADGTGAAARFGGPGGLASDAAGNLFVADNNSIRKVTPDGAVTTFVGDPTTSGSADGTGSAARFNGPVGVAIGATGNLFVADYDNLEIRMVTPDGVVTTLAGAAGIQGTDDGTGSDARFISFTGIAVDRADNVYVTELIGTIRKITPDGVVTTLAGCVDMRGSIDGVGSAARFRVPQGPAVDAAGQIYVADFLNSEIRKLAPDGFTTTLAGTTTEVGIALGTPPRFAAPWAVALRGDDLVIGDSSAILVMHRAR